MSGLLNATQPCGCPVCVHAAEMSAESKAAKDRVELRVIGVARGMRPVDPLEGRRRAEALRAPQVPDGTPTHGDAAEPARGNLASLSALPGVVAQRITRLRFTKPGRVDR